MVPCSRLSENSRSAILSPVWRSRLPVGSSANRMAGRPLKAGPAPPAAVRRRRAAPAGGAGVCQVPAAQAARGHRPGSGYRWRRAAAPAARRSPGVERRDQHKRLKTKPTCCARSAARASSSIRCSGLPSIDTSPLLPSSRPARIASRVDLPEPDSPIRAMVCRGLTTSSTPVRMES
nr:Uncharacterised protein [Klebsiella pneumoniae]